jgi:hypothetical protein
MRATNNDELTSTIDGTDGLPTKVLEVANPQMAMNYERSAPTCPMPKLPTLFSMEPGRPSKEDKLAGHAAASSSWALLSGEPHFNLGVLVINQSTSDNHLAAIAKPASSCAVTSLVILQQQPGRDNDNNENPAKNSDSSSSIVREWLNINEIKRHDEASISLGWGEDGFQTLLKKPDIHAIYIVVPSG